MAKGDFGIDVDPCMALLFDNVCGNRRQLRGFDGANARVGDELVYASSNLHTLYFATRANTVCQLEGACITEKIEPLCEWWPYELDDDAVEAALVVERGRARIRGAHYRGERAPCAEKRNQTCFHEGSPQRPNENKISHR
jgi:hypothetical protein